MVRSQRRRASGWGLSCPLDLDGFMHGTLLNGAVATAKQSQLWIRPEASVLDPPSEEFVLARDPDAAKVLSFLHTNAAFNFSFGTLHHERMNISLPPKCAHSFRLSSSVPIICDALASISFIRIQTEYPVARCFLDRRILLTGIALPRLNKDLRPDDWQSLPYGRSKLSPRR